MNCGVECGIRLTLIGPMPPPVNGQSVVMSHVVARLAPHFANMRVADIGEGQTGGWLGRLVGVGRSMRAWWCIPGSQAVYIAVKADHGMWLTTATAALARLSRARVFLHHHSYCYVRERKPRMVALARVAGPRAHHIVLAKSMARDLKHVMPEIRRTSIVGNAALVDASLLDLPQKVDGGQLVLGHLSNLYLDKGIVEAVDLAVELNRAGTPARLIVGGPTTDSEARRHLDRAARELGGLFEYRGTLSGEAKHAFFADITHFIFPSRYTHESVPLVLYEAMASGAVCLSTRHGAIPEQLADSPAIIASSKDTFVEETLPALIGATGSSDASRESRRAFTRSLAESQEQLGVLAALLASD
jgi:glycosyltransferase involved in cell wall biosynthesis